MIDFEKLAQNMGDLEEDLMKEQLQQVMDEGGQDAEKALEACQRGMAIVGDLFESGDYYVSDLIYAGELMADAVDILKDALVADGDGAAKSKVVCGTVKDDLHDIGKNIVISMLEANGFDIVDLGIDVPAEKFVDAVKESDAKIVALSGVLTLAIDSMKDTIELLRRECPGVKVIIGGAPVSEEAMHATGADAWAHSPQKTIKVCSEWAAA